MASLAASSAISICSLSRISPTRMTFGGLPQGGPQRHRKAGRVAVQLPLVNDGSLVAMHESTGLRW